MAHEPILLLSRAANPAEFLESAKTAFADETLLQLANNVRGGHLQTVADDVVTEALQMVDEGRYADAARTLRIAMAPGSFEIAVYNDDYPTFLKSMVFIGSLHFYELLFAEAGL